MKVKAHNKINKKTGHAFTVREHDRITTQQTTNRTQKVTSPTSLLEETSQSETKQPLTRKEKLDEVNFVTRVTFNSLASGAATGMAGWLASSGNIAVTAISAAGGVAEASAPHILHSKVIQRKIKRSPGKPEEGQHRRNAVQFMVDHVTNKYRTFSKSVKWGGVGGAGAVAFGVGVGPALGIAAGVMGVAFLFSYNSDWLKKRKQESELAEKRIAKKLAKTEKNLDKKISKIKNLKKAVREAQRTARETAVNNKALLEKEKKNDITVDILQAEKDFYLGVIENQSREIERLEAILATKMSSGTAAQ